jgi:UDP-3-O-[3-hydroxymyristoyl] glucosamine N-acyltransferase
MNEGFKLGSDGTPLGAASYTAAEIAEQVGGSVEGNGTLRLTGFAAADTAGKGDLTFAESETWFARAQESAASAILVGPQIEDPEVPRRKVLIRVPNARVAFAKVLPLFFPEPGFAAGIHPSAIIHHTAQIAASAHIGPCCVVGERVRIDKTAVLQANNHIGADSHIGEATRLFPGVTIYPHSVIGARVRIHAGSVIGSDGFGYVFDQGHHRKVPQVGNVVIHDDVEIGANVTIDRGALGSTVIGKGAKIDNLVQIAHNVVIGEHTIIIAQVGVAGSTKLGQHVILAGQVGIAGHLNIGDHAVVAAQSGVMTHIPEGEKWLGSPALPDRQTKRQWIALQKLPELLQRVHELEKQLAAEKKK